MYITEACISSKQVWFGGGMQDAICQQKHNIKSKSGVFGVLKTNET